VYGGMHLTAGAGSVIALNGDAGDPVVEMRHLKQPMEEVGPFQVVHDHAAGVSSIYRSTDLVVVARSGGAAGVTARNAAMRLFESDKPTASQVEKTRRRLVALADSGALIHVPGGSRAVADAWVAAQPDVDTLGGLVAPAAEVHEGFTEGFTGFTEGSRSGGPGSRFQQTRRSGLHAVEAPQTPSREVSVNHREPHREALTSTNAENMNPREGNREPFTLDPPLRGGVESGKVGRQREGQKPAVDSGARVVLSRGGHVVDAGTGEVVE